MWQQIYIFYIYIYIHIINIYIHIHIIYIHTCIYCIYIYIYTTSNSVPCTPCTHLDGFPFQNFCFLQPGLVPVPRVSGTPSPEPSNTASPWAPTFRDAICPMRRPETEGISLWEWWFMMLYISMYYIIYMIWYDMIWYIYIYDIYIICSW